MWKKSSRLFRRSVRRVSPKSSANTASSRSSYDSLLRRPPFRNEPRPDESHQRNHARLRPGTRPAPPTCCTGADLGFAGSIVDGGNNAPVVVEADLTGLTPGATYHYQVFASNNVGTVATERHSLRRRRPNPVTRNARTKRSASKTAPPASRNAAPTSWSPPHSRPATGRTMRTNERQRGHDQLTQSGAGNINNSGYGGIFSELLYRRPARHEGLGDGREPQRPAGLALRATHTISQSQFGPGAYSPDLRRRSGSWTDPGTCGNSVMRRMTARSPISRPATLTPFVDPFRGGSEDLKHMFWTGEATRTTSCSGHRARDSMSTSASATPGPRAGSTSRQRGTPISNCEVGVLTS